MLWLDNNQITEIQRLHTLTNLQVLNLAKNQITKIKNLDNLVNLQEIVIGWNPMEKAIMRQFKSDYSNLKVNY